MDRMPLIPCKLRGKTSYLFRRLRPTSGTIWLLFNRKRNRPNIANLRFVHFIGSTNTTQANRIGLQAPQNQLSPVTAATSKGRTYEKNTCNADLISTYGAVVCACLGQNLRQAAAPARQLHAYALRMCWRWP